MYSKYNPFKENRTEQMRDLWKYYVPFSESSNTFKPLVVEGGRGSGKTMFFQCKSWKEEIAKARKEQCLIKDWIKYREYIGLYYRVDTTFVSSMKGSDRTDWDKIFETYLAICVLREVLLFLTEIKSDLDINDSTLNKFACEFSKKIEPEYNIETFDTFIERTTVYLDRIEDIINGIDINIGSNLRFVKVLRFVNDLCEECQSLICQDIVFKIFIDEYETLQESQQRIVNTLIKHSEIPVIYNIGLRPSGMKTPKTISDTETIESPHDFEYQILDVELDKYKDILRDICRKRIKLAKENGKVNCDVNEEIEFYLGNYDFDFELGMLEDCSNVLDFKELLVEKIHVKALEENLSEDMEKQYIKVLCTDASVLSARLHLTLLYKNNVYTPSLKTLHDAYISNSDKYKDWLHNRKNGIIFLLCKECKKEKMYFGFDAYAALSSGIVRYFLELCEQAFDFAFLDDYSWNSQISPQTQTEAAKHVSEYKVRDILRYEPNGKKMRIFVQFLGQIFNKIHTDNGTLGEPEPNHFSTKDLSMSDEVRDNIKNATMWNVLQIYEATKRKDSKLSPETVDYYLNKIYVPYFGISYRNQRKIVLSSDLLSDLFSGDTVRAKAAFNKYFRVENKDFGQVSFEQLGVGESYD